MEDKVDWTKPIQTRDGRPARLIREYLRSDYPYVVCIRSGENEVVGQRNVDGKPPSGICSSPGDDIVNVPIAKPRIVTGWVNVMRSEYDGGYFCDGTVFPTQKEAVAALGTSANAGEIVSITYTVREDVKP